MCVSDAAKTFVTITLPLLVPTASVYVGLYKLALLGAFQSIYLCFRLHYHAYFQAVVLKKHVLIRFVILIMVSLSHRRRLSFHLFLLILVPIILADASWLKTHSIGSSADALAFGEIGGLILTTWLIGFVYYALGAWLRVGEWQSIAVRAYSAMFQFAVHFSIQTELFRVEYRRYFVSTMCFNENMQGETLV